MPSLPPLHAYFLAAYPLYPLVGVVVTWTILCGCIGFLLGRRPQPTRLVFVPEREWGTDEDPVEWLSKTQTDVAENSPN